MACNVFSLGAKLLNDVFDGDTPAGIARAENEDGSIYVLPLAITLNLSGELTCDWRDGEVW